MAEATVRELIVGIAYALAFAAVLAEVAWVARRPGPVRRDVLSAAATASVMAAGALVVGFGYTSALRALWGAVGGWRPEPLAALWNAQPVVAAVAAFVVWDLAGWAYHLVGHRSRIGWAAHQVHHTGTSFDLTLGLRQTWMPFHGLLIFSMVAVAGFGFETVVVCAAVSNCWQVLQHTCAPVRFPRWFAAVVMTPESHRHHHGRDADATNLGPCLTVWDRLAGTWVPMATPVPEAYGLAAASSSNPLTVELAGWRQLLRQSASGGTRTPTSEDTGT